MGEAIPFDPKEEADDLLIWAVKQVRGKLDPSVEAFDFRKRKGKTHLTKEHIEQTVDELRDYCDRHYSRARVISLDDDIFDFYGRRKYPPEEQENECMIRLKLPEAKATVKRLMEERHPIRSAIKSLVSHNWTVTIIGGLMVGIGVAWAIWKLGWNH